jgi:hypothetical protein
VGKPSVIHPLSLSTGGYPDQSHPCQALTQGDHLLQEIYTRSVLRTHPTRAFPAYITSGWHPAPLASSALFALASFVTVPLGIVFLYKAEPLSAISAGDKVSRIWLSCSNGTMDAEFADWLRSAEADRVMIDLGASSHVAFDELASGDSR